MPKISVIVPVYNVEAYLHRCVDSVLSQTFTDFELILVDDGSPDTSGHICDEYRTLDSRVTVIHQKNQGVSGARNTGIDYAQTTDSEWITFIDSDDYVVPRYLEALLKAAQGYSLSVGARALTEGEDLPEYPEYTVSLRSTSELCLTIHGNFTLATAKLFRKELFSELRFPLGKMHEDVFTTHKILFRFDTTPFVPEPLYAHFRNPTSLTESAWTPGRLDELDALVEQIAFLVDKGLMDVAESRFRTYMYRNYIAQDMIKAYTGASAAERQALLERTNHQLQDMLKRYRKYHWCRWWKDRQDFWITMTAFGPQGLHDTYRKIKARITGQNN